MVTIRSVNEIILSLIDFFRLSQPDLDTKPGTVARDLFVEAPASQLALLYEELSNNSNQQSLRLVVGSELDQLAKNFGVVRRKSTTSTGVALCTFSSINATININKGDIIIANNGFSFAVSTGIAISNLASNYYRSVATKFRDQLDLVGITDEYAVEVTVSATSAGSAGNIGKYALNRTNIPGVSNVTNINGFAGGTDQEDDTAFRNRVLAAFSGSSVGTALGYLNVAMGTSGVSDAVVVEPGSVLMTRDGTDVAVNNDGSRTIVSEGTGGKVDVVVLGSNLIENADSYIFQDKSNTNDPTSNKNNIVLGQILGDENKTINKKRIDNIKSGELPAQPVDTIIQVTGTSSGSNFVEKSVDSYGRVTGNYELINDTGSYGGSAWGFDTFHWISNKISLFGEDRVKGQFNGQDTVSFTDILDIPIVQQFISITNENSIVTYDRSIIQLLHKPVTNVTRIFNVNTGERYVIVSQNPDNTGTYNQTGRIKISGNTLPASNDVLQVDYSWIVDFDSHSDYDGLTNTSNARTVTDSIDWGYSSLIKKESITFTKSNNYFYGTSSHPISSIIDVKKYLEKDGTVERLTSGVFANRLAVVITNLENQTETVDSIVLKNTNTELFSTSQQDGTFTNLSVVVGIQVLYNTTIILPTDSLATAGDVVTVTLNSADVFYSSSTNGSFNSSQITIPSSLVNTTANTIILDATYIALVTDLFSSATTSLPTSRRGNGFSLLNNNGFNNFSIVNNSRRENQTVQQNLSSQYYLELSLSSVEFNLTSSQILSVIRLSDNKELWNSDYPGSISVGDSGNYQIILSGINTPAINDRALIVYYATDIRRYQPFSYDNSIIKSRLDTLQIDPISGQMIVKLNNFITQGAGLTFTVIEPNTDIALFSVTDGYLTAGSSNAIIGSLSVNFATLPDLIYKKIKITGATNTNNNGTYDITNYNILNNTITISNSYNNILKDQICILKISDGQEIWNYSGTIEVSNNRLLLPLNTSLHVGDSVYVYFFNFNNLRAAPTRLIGTTVDQVINAGVISLSGTTFSKATDIVFTATNTGLQQNLFEAIRKVLGISSSTAIPTNVKLVKLIKLEKVTTVSANSEEVLQVNTTYDVFGSTIQNNLYYSSEMSADSSLQNLEFILPSTTNNTINVSTKNLPTIGDKLRATFYYITENDSENLVYTRNGTLYTNKKFVFINRAYVSSGFRSSQSTKFTLTSFTQPSVGARYKIFYDYLAPKQNERITIRYNYNKLIADTTFNIESTRPVNADVLVRGAKLVLVDLTMNVVIANDYLSSSNNVIQNLRDKLTLSLTATQLGTIVDSATLINVAQAVPGIARARILYFNKVGGSGQVLKITAQEDEFFAPNSIITNIETR